MVFLRFRKSHRKTLAVEFLFKKVSGLQSQHRSFPVNFAKVLRPPFSHNTPGREIHWVFVHFAYHCRELSSTTKLTHEISSHKSYIPILLSFFTHVPVLLSSLTLAPFTYKTYTNVIICKCHIVLSHLIG